MARIQFSLHAVFGQRAGLVEEEVACRGQHLDRIQPLQQHATPRQLVAPANTCMPALAHLFLSPSFQPKRQIAATSHPHATDLSNHIGTLLLLRDEFAESGEPPRAPLLPSALASFQQGLLVNVRKMRQRVGRRLARLRPVPEEKSILKQGPAGAEQLHTREN